jgi:septal ring factor EnvC (AmiA/AmiB activator)
MQRRTTRIAAWCCFALAAGAAAQDPAVDPERAQAEQDAKTRLQAVREQMRALDAERSGTRSEIDILTAALRNDELTVNELARGVRLLEHDLDRRREELATLQARRAELERTLTSQRRAMAALLRSAYAVGRHDQLRMLFAPERATDVARLLAYHRYLERDRTRRIEAVTHDLNALATLTREVADASAALEAQRIELSAQSQRLDAARGERAKTLASLNAKLGDQTTRLRALGKDEQALLDLLERLRDAIGDVPMRLAGSEALSSLRGRVPWPVRGAVVTAFGARAVDGRVADGWRIAADAGSAVRAVAHGRVAYADWLKGYGLLIIVDHGDGYMSLYAHNDTLSKDVGDWVEAGEALGTVGSSGGNAEAGLYFELRKDGVPLDPVRWLTRAPR